MVAWQRQSEHTEILFRLSLPIIGSTELKIQVSWTISTNSSKTSLGPEKYLSDVQDPQRRQTQAKFRLSDHKLAVETLRYARPKVEYDNRKCPLCQTEVENEIHLLFNCSWAGYADIGKTFEIKMVGLVKNYEFLHATDKAAYLMIQENKEILNSVADYIASLFSTRNQQLR